MAVPPDGRRPASARCTSCWARVQPVSGLRPVVERHHEELVGGIEQVEQEPVDGRARVLDPLAEHAVADVEQHAEADRHALVGELRDRLLHAVLEDLERLARQAGDQMPFGVGDGGGDAGELDAGLEQAVVA